MNHATPTILAALLTMQAYHITRWDDLYETAETRRVRTLTYFSKPIKFVGEGVGEVFRQKDWGELYATWTFVLESLAATAPQEWRGWLVRNGTPLDAQRMSALTRVPQASIERALEFFSTAPMDWLEKIEWPGEQPAAARLHHGHAQGRPGEQPAAARLPTTRGKIDKEREEGTKGGGTPPSDAAVFEFAESWLGDPGTETPPLAREFVLHWIAQMSGRSRGWPADWQRKLVADWRVAWKEFQKKPAAKKNGAVRERWQVEKDLAAVREQLRTHPKTTWAANKPLPEKIRADFDALVDRRKALEKELSHE